MFFFKLLSIIIFYSFFCFNVISEEILDSPIIEKPYNNSELKSGNYFLREETRKIELDEFENPGMIWVERGEELFSLKEGKNDSSCLSCHNKDINSLVGVAISYPKVYNDKLLNLEQKINICRQNKMKLDTFELEGNRLLSLSSFVTYLSKGMPISVAIEGEAEKYFKKGKKLYFQRVGQMNLACNQCHDKIAGRYLRAERISQGHINGFPSYLMRWDSVASVHRRFQFCNNQARAEPLEIGHDDYNALQLYVAWRGNSLLIESPSVRR